MGTMNELDAALSGLNELCKEITDAVRSIREMLGSREAAAAEPAAETKPVTLEEIRAVLLEKRKAGYEEEVRAILIRHGAERLTRIDPSEYPAMMEEAEAIGL